MFDILLERKIAIEIGIKEWVFSPNDNKMQTFGMLICWMNWCGLELAQTW